MSFLNTDLEAQKDQVHKINESSSKTSLIVTKASNLLTDFANGVSGLERLINQIGTKRDSTQLRQTIESTKIYELNEYKQQLDNLINDISHLINSNLGNVSSSDKFSEEKLRMEFESITKTFNTLKRTYNERKSSVILSEKVNQQNQLQNEITQSSESTPLISSQEQQQQLQQQQTYTLLQQDIDIHTILAQERANEIRKIHGGVEEINSIYRELGHLVQQQGTQVDTIENNLADLSNHTQNASSELVKADNYQKQKRKWSCILLIILVIILLIIILAVFA